MSRWPTGRKWEASTVATATVLPVREDKLHFVGDAAFVDVNDRAHIACLQILRRQIARQHHAIMFFDLHFM
jgi:hypothetical protein